MRGEGGQCSKDILEESSENPNNYIFVSGAQTEVDGSEAGLLRVLSQLNPPTELSEPKLYWIQKNFEET